MQEGDLPRQVQQQLESLIGSQPPVISIKTDVDSSLRYGKQCLVATEQDVLVFERRSDGWLLLKRLPVADIEEVRTIGMVSIGAIEAMVKGHPETLVFFSNAIADSVNRAARALDCLARNRPLTALESTESQSRKCPTCGFFMGPSRVCPRCLKKGLVLHRLFMVSRPYWHQMAVILVLLLVSTGMNLVPPLLTKTLIDTAIPDARYNLLFYIFLALVGLHLASTLLGIVKARMATRVSCRVTYDLREQMFRQLQSMSVSYYDRNQVGSLMARITRDTEELQSFITQITTGIFFNILTIIGVGCMLLWLDWRLCLYVVVPWPFVVFGTLRFWKHMVPRIKRLIFARWRISAGLNSTLSGIRVVKAFAQEEFEEQRFQDRNSMVFESNVDVQNYWNTYYPLITFFFPVGGFLVWYLGGREAANSVITLGSLVAFISLLGRFQAPLMALTQTSNQMTRFLTAAQRIFEILDQTAEISDDPDAVELEDVQGAVEFQDVSFGYLPNQLILQDVSFQLKPGEMIGIVGSSGAGKTTLINLICRFYDADEGTVLVDGVDVRKITKDSLRKHIGLVLQEPFLFRGTISENIAYGKPDATREEIIRASKAANAHEFIVKLPEGYDTRLGERGAGVSVGEKQRISIARAILFNPKILILDEATSSVDLETERRVQQALEKLVHNRTTIAIAHRLSTLRNADRIMVLDHKSIQEIGTHDDLMASRGLYYRLMCMQEGQKLEDQVVHIAG